MKGESRPCAVCGKNVYIPHGRLGRLHYFCSPEHHNEWQGRNKETHTCKTCGMSFRRSASLNKDGTITYCSLQCRDADPERTIMLIEMTAKQQRIAMSKPEQALYELLDELHVPHERQHVISGKFCVDAFVPNAKTVIQMDGDYWHGNPSLFPTPDARQRKRIALDTSQDAYLRTCGYRIIRIWASDLRNTPLSIKQRILSLLSH